MVLPLKPLGLRFLFLFRIVDMLCVISFLVLFRVELLTNTFPLHRLYIYIYIYIYCCVVFGVVACVVFVLLLLLLLFCCFCFVVFVVVVTALFHLCKDLSYHSSTYCLFVKFV
jgi:hypothetical protein